MTFTEWVAELPEPVREWLVQAELNSPSDVADSVAPEYHTNQAGDTLVKPVDAVFVEAVSEAVECVKPASKAWTRTL